MNSSFINKKGILFLLLSVFVFQILFAQKKEPKEPSVYKVNLKWEIPLTVGLIASETFGFKLLDSKPRLTSEKIAALDANDIWKFDRIATEQDASFRKQAHDISDMVLNGSVILPAFLAFDKNIRKDWLDLLVLYGESHGINTGIYFIAAGSIDRIRPFVYNPDVQHDDKLISGTTLSFFSGHVSSSAASTFFMAKVYSDYHPELGNKKFWLYGAAIIPPAIVGYYRFKAMKHFPTDIMTGMAVGAAVGILVPQLHKIKNKESKYSFIPFAGDVTGLTIKYAIR